MSTNDHFGGGGSGSGSGGLNASEVNALILSASVNNLTNSFSSDVQNTYSMVTFADAGGRGVKRARVSQDDLVENGRVIINSNTAQSIQFPETRGASGYALTMHRDPVLAALGRTEWYSESVVVPDDLQVSSISSLNPGVTPLEIKTAVNFTGGQVVDYANSTCSNITTLDAVELKATTSLETPLVKNDTGTLSVTSSTGLNLTSSAGPVNISADALQTVQINAGGRIKLIAPITEAKGVLSVGTNLIVEGTTNLNGNVFCNNGLAAIKAPIVGGSAGLALINSASSALGNLTASEDLVAVVAKDLRRLKLVADDTEYLVIDPGTVESAFTVTIGQPATLNTIRGTLIVESGISTTGATIVGSLQTDFVNSTGDLKILADNTLTLSLDNSGEVPIMVVEPTGITSFKKQTDINSGLLNVVAPEALEISKFRLLDVDNKDRSTYEATDSKVFLRIHDDRVFQLFKDNTTSYMNVDPANTLSTYAVDLGVTAQDTRINGSTIQLTAPTQLAVTSPLTQLSGNLGVSANAVVAGQINQFAGITPGGVPVLASYYRRITEFVLANSDVETNMLDPAQGIGVTSLPPNTLQVGSSFIFSATGIASTDGKNSDIIYRVNFNGATLVTTGVANVVGDNQFHEIVIYFTVQTTGPTGSVCIVGSIRNGDATLPLAYVPSTPLDTTVSNSLEITAQWAVQAAGDELRLGIVNLSSI